MKSHIFTLLILLLNFVVCGQNKNPLNQQIKVNEDSIGFIQIKTDSIFNSNQIISLLVLQKNDSNKFKIDFGHSHSDLTTTSSFAKSNNAIAAINYQ